MDQYNKVPCWQKLSESEKKSIIMKLLDQLDMSNKSIRMKAARCILYLAQVSTTNTTYIIKTNPKFKVLVDNKLYNFRVALSKYNRIKNNKNGHVQML